MVAAAQFVADSDSMPVLLCSLWWWPQAVCLSGLGPVQPAIGSRREGKGHQWACDGPYDGVDGAVERERHGKGCDTQGCRGREKHPIKQQKPIGQ